MYAKRPLFFKAKGRYPHMKFLHTADLHIGKKLFEMSLLEDQKYILNQIYEIALREQVDAVLIAGDVYDRAVPSTEAVTLLDDFLTKLVEVKIPVLMISGNHDSPERVAFADSILEKQGLHIAGNYQVPLKTVTLEDAYGPVTFVCMPFVKPAVTGEVNSAQAVERMLGGTPMTLSLRQRYVLLTHYFVTGERGEMPELSDSETDVNVGGLDNVPADYFKNFCYVALGHIHKPQRVGNRNEEMEEYKADDDKTGNEEYVECGESDRRQKSNIYYAGSPLKYSFSEALGTKSVNIVELGEPGEVHVRCEKLKPLRELRCIKGRLAELINPEVLAQVSDGREDYIQATLTDTEELIDPIGTLRSVYPNVLQILLEKRQLAEGAEYESRIQGKRKSTVELFGEFYELLKGEPMDEKRRAVVAEAAAEAGELNA